VLTVPFLFFLGIIADSAELYPPGLLPIINQANELLSAGQFNDAARAYSDAIGRVLLSTHTHTDLDAVCTQNSHRPTTFCTTNELRRIFHSVDTAMRWTTLTRCI
jgi:hypothetical protein